MSDHIGGDQISAGIGDEAKNAVVGSHNRQTISEDSSDRRQVNEINVSSNDDAELWRAVANLDMRLTVLEHETRANARQYYIAIVLFIVVIASLWYLSMKIDGYTRAAINLSKIATEQRK